MYKLKKFIQHNKAQNITLYIQFFSWHTQHNHHYSITVPSHECYSVSNHRQLDCLFNSFFRLAKDIKTPLCEEKPLLTNGSPSQRASKAKKFFMSRRLHVHAGPPLLHENGNIAIFTKFSSLNAPKVFISTMTKISSKWKHFCFYVRSDICPLTLRAPGTLRTYSAGIECNTNFYNLWTHITLLWAIKAHN